MDSWDEVRTAFQVAKAGTVSGAADVLGVHHATVIRHIDALEDRLGVRLFQRHARGYTATEAGADLLKVAQVTDDQFSQLEGRIKGQGQGLKGELVVTTLDNFADMLTPVLTAYQQEHPDVIVRFLTGVRLFRMEYGEAHVAIRAGSKPEEPDNVVQHYRDLEIVMVASKDYIARAGMPDGEQSLKSHRFVGFDDENSRAPFAIWLRERVGFERFTFRGSDDRAVLAAIRNGAGIGFVSRDYLNTQPNLVEVFPPQAVWSVPLWLVTHVDLHRTDKVQSLLSFLKADLKGKA